MSLKLNEENLVVQSLEAVPVDEGRNNDKLIMIIMPLWDSFVLFDPFHCFIVRDKVFGLYYVEFPVSLIVTDIRSALALQYVVITSCGVFFFLQMGDILPPSLTMSVNKCMMQIPCHRQFTCCVFYPRKKQSLTICQVLRSQ